ncbi:MAG: hypothetical protein QOI31_1300 [Solirubrobacterales bacterium]|jgi:diguanylate cyclase (GGDEF)-like protein|nr:hypothetical protein [Solirubrobacterales bacterium]
MPTERDNNGTRRDKDASIRDLDAEARDASAKALDSMARDQTALTESAAESRGRSAADRAQAAEDRKGAAHDREVAAGDRALAIADRDEARKALDVAHLDDLTGVYRRGAGVAALEQAIDRARREKGSLVLGFVDIDGLKLVNDATGHAAGDVLIVSVANAMRSRMRSYEPIVRFGGDEFVCAMSNVDAVDAESRFEEIRAAIAADTQGTISLGLATLSTTDDLESLINRADAALIASRNAPV